MGVGSSVADDGVGSRDDLLRRVLIVQRNRHLPSCFPAYDDRGFRPGRRSRLVPPSLSELKTGLVLYDLNSSSEALSEGEFGGLEEVAGVFGFVEEGFTVFREGFVEFWSVVGGLGGDFGGEVGGEFGEEGWEGDEEDGRREEESGGDDS